MEIERKWMVNGWPEAMRGMLRRKTIIVPSTLMRLATTAQKLVPTPLLMPIVAHQQKKKLG